MPTVRLPARFAIAGLVAVAFAASQPAGAQSGPGSSAPAVPGVITQGAGSVSVGSLPAARQGDATDGGQSVVQGSPDVFIGGKPAATVGDRTGCGGIVVGGSSNVFVNGKPLARAGDLTTGCTQ
jgi:uncharacterized Zn-binding protein involved in type VI secretion